MKRVKVIANSEETYEFLISDIGYDILMDENVIEKFKETRIYKSDEWDFSHLEAFIQIHTVGFMRLGEYDVEINLR